MKRISGTGRERDMLFRKQVKRNQKRQKRYSHKYGNGEWELIDPHDETQVRKCGQASERKRPKRD